MILWDSDIFLDLDLRLAGTVVGIAGKLKKRERNVSQLLLPVKLVRVLVLEMLVELILRREAFGAAGDGAREKSSLGVPLDVPLELSFVVEESRAEVAGELTARRDLRLHSDSMRPQVMIQLRDRVEFLRALTAHVLLNLMVSLHVIVQVGDLRKRPTAIHFDAYEWTFAGVESSVVVEVCDLRKRFAAVDAKRF